MTKATAAKKEAMRKYLKGNKKWLKYLSRYRQKLKVAVINHYSKGSNICMCEKCDVSQIEFLTIDHIKRGGNRHRKIISKKVGLPFYRWLIQQKFPKGYQVLCLNCNIGKSNNHNICPHSKY